MFSILIFHLLTIVNQDFKQNFHVVENKISVQKDIEKDYDQLYIYRSEDKAIVQKLFVKYLEKNKLAFKLVIIRANCDTEKNAVASSNASGDGEIDEDADGNAYLAIEYKFEDKDSYLGIRISEDKTLAKIV
jgi:hypothetical protein